MSGSTSVVTYGNFVRPARQGVLGLPMGVALLCIPLVVGVVLMLVQTWYLAAVGTAVLGVVAAGLAVVGTRQGRSIYSRRLLLGAHRRKTARGDNLYVAGPAGKVPDGSFTLPGLMAPSALSQHADAFGTPFGLLHLRGARHYTVVLEAYPDGDALVDQARIDSQVAHWGAWLGQLALDEDVVGASVTVETAPDSGVRLTRMVQANLVEDASAFARTVIEDVVRELGTGSPIITTRIAVTFSGRSHDGRGRDRGVATMAEEIGNRLPVLLASLWETGAGTSVRACTAQDIVDFTRTAYDPTVATQVEQARAEDGTGLTWAEAGPTFADDQVEQYFHDRAVSRSWQMYEVREGQFHSNALTRLLEPNGGVLRKRVTLLYRPVPAGQAADAIEAELNNAIFTGSQKQQVSARQRARLAYAHKAGEEEAQGAGLVRFGVIVTVTCAAQADFPRLERLVPSLGNQARLRLRPALGNQAVAFQAALPLGLVLPEHSMLPAQLRDYL
ncbi:SCO6880 family protein [Aquipuribacter hungaricus]|uniref:SCO6880 family protein n=1 Tax=Aquipuribacter hungaricus TaxID=545624 RepID=UPI0030ECF7A7